MFRKENTLWVEAFRPTILDNYIGNSEVVDKITTFITSNDIPHLLLAGKAGSGKTTLAKIIVNNITCDYLYVNASDKSGLDFIRTELIPFASSAGFNDLKIVVLDECLEHGTLVTILRNGAELKIPIESLNDEIDLVKTFNIQTNTIEWQPFKLFDKGMQDIWEMELENGEIVRCTGDHKWFVDDSGIKVVKTYELHNYNYILSPI